MTDEAVTIIVHGSSCPNWKEPTTNEEWLALQLTWEAEGDWTFGTCPVCKRHVFTQGNFGTLDFGCDVPEDVDEDEHRAFIETFVPLAGTDT